MNYFTIKYSNAIDSDQWKQLINPNVRTDGAAGTYSWFIREKNKYGNYKHYRPFIAIITVFNIVAVGSMQILTMTVFKNNQPMIMNMGYGELKSFDLSMSDVHSVHFDLLS